MHYYKLFIDQLITLYSYIASAFIDTPVNDVVSLNPIEKLLGRIEDFNDIVGFHKANPRVLTVRSTVINTHQIINTVRKLNVCAWNAWDINEVMDILRSYSEASVPIRNVSWYELLEDEFGEPIRHYTFLLDLHTRLTALNTTLCERRAEEESNIILQSMYLMIHDIDRIMNSLTLDLK